MSLSTCSGPGETALPSPWLRVATSPLVGAVYVSSLRPHEDPSSHRVQYHASYSPNLLSNPLILPCLLTLVGVVSTAGLVFYYRNALLPFSRTYSTSLTTGLINTGKIIGGGYVFVILPVSTLYQGIFYPRQQITSEHIRPSGSKHDASELSETSLDKYPLREGTITLLNFQHTLDEEEDVIEHSLS